MDQRIKTEYVSLPESVKGVSTVLNDNSYLIVVNSLLSEEDQREALEHEFEHIRRGDFDKEHLNVNEAENEVHRMKKGSV